MSLCQLFLQKESVYNITAVLGEKSICQFRDLNHSLNSFQRKYVSEIRRCIEMERKIAFFEKEMERDSIPIVREGNEPQAPSMKDIGHLEQRLDKLEHDLTNEIKTHLQLKHRLLSLTEYRAILKNADQFFTEVQNTDQSKASKMMRRLSVVDPNLMRRFSIQMTNNTDIQIPLDPVVDLVILTGTILATRFLSFERMLWRVSRHNILLKRIDMEELLEDPETGEMQQKSLFILVCQGEKLRDTCKKICTGFHAKLYTCPEQNNERNSAYAAVLRDINDIMDVINKTDEHRKNILAVIAKNMLEWKMTICKAKCSYETMNMFSDSISEQCLIAECWIPDSRLSDAKLALQQGQSLSDSVRPSVLNVIATGEQVPPTYNVTNKFTSGFQNIIDSYGACSYGEINPAPYAIITFPFIFAVMFGDTGHGIIMSLFAFYLILKENQLKNVRDEIFSMFFGGRYIILLMGLFSIYTGAIYNDIFSKSVNLFGSAFNRNLENGGECPNNATDCEITHLVPKNHLDPNFRYPFGVDPVWQLTTNKVQYLNTYKMKVSVILGVMQMLFGVILSLFNHLHRKHWISVFFEFIPQVIFLLGIFGYMNFMIFFKWFKYTDRESGVAPSLLITLINMFMFKMPADTDPAYLREPMFDGQWKLQSILIITALLCVPVMLLVKPIYMNVKHKKQQNQPSEIICPIHNLDTFEMKPTGGPKLANGPDGKSSSDEQISIPVSPPEVAEQLTLGGHDHFESFGDAFINQAIHTIEYCLGSVSHTASYLRLWALSLAHAQLSEVLWHMIMKNGFKGFPIPAINGVKMFFIFAFWATLTVAILIIMEGLSAFLHALRLHWVEFMSKFYSGTGIPFQPFSFRTIIDQL